MTCFLKPLSRIGSYWNRDFWLRSKSLSIIVSFRDDWVVLCGICTKLHPHSTPMSCHDHSLRCYIYLPWKLLWIVANSKIKLRANVLWSMHWGFQCTVLPLYVYKFLLVFILSCCLVCEQAKLLIPENWWLHYWHQSVVRTVTNTELTLIDGVNYHQHAIDNLKPCLYTQDHANLIAHGVVAEAEADSNIKA